LFRYFIKVLNALSTGPFYQKYVQLPTPDAPVPPFIANNPKFFPFFCNAIGAIDGTHINASQQLVFTFTTGGTHISPLVFARFSHFSTTPLQQRLEMQCNTLPDWIGEVSTIPCLRFVV